ncbi:MAG: sugar-binding domain-containing protein, partial [Phycisphaerae bacterium]
MVMRRWMAGVVGLAMMVGAARGERVGFDEGWRFSRGDVKGAEGVGFDDSKWEGVELPHDWSVGGKIEKGGATGDKMGGQGGFFPAGVGWYRKKFVAPKAWAGKRVSLDFEGVYMLGEVWVNGEKVGGHAYGYTPFAVDVTEKLKSGEENVVAVRVDDSKQVNSRWYSGSGIYRHVWVEVEGPVRIARDGVMVKTGKWADDSASITIGLTAEDGSGAAAAAEFETKVYEVGADGKATGSAVVASIPMRGEFLVRDGVRLNETGVETRLILAHAKWWSPEAPNLYVAETTLSMGGKVIDTRETYFGVRTVGASAEKGFLLNGKREVLFGGCVHHDNGALGAAAFDRAEERKVELLKGAGFNAVRTSHNMPSEAFLNACDRLGVMVVEEGFDCWEVGKNGEDYHRYFARDWKGDVDAMGMRDRNHPSVVMWSVGNEIPDFGSAQGMRDGTALIEEVKRLDGTRPVTAAVNWWPHIGGKEHDWTWEGADGLKGKLDVVGYNYQIGRYGKDHARVPGRVMVSTESYPRDMFACWEACEERPYVVGDFVWTAMDYLGESGLGRVYARGEKEIFQGRDEQYPVHGANCGDIDMTGWRKAVSHARNIVWGRGEKLFASVVEPRGDG